MAPTTSASSLPSRRLSAHTIAATAPIKDDDHALSQSLSQLSLLSSGDQKNGSRRLSEALQRPSSSRRTSVSPGHRMPSRSPSGRDSRPTTPPLLRKASMNSLHSANGHGPGRVPSRRSSMTQAMGSPKVTRSPSVGSLKAEEHRPPLTAASVAADYFRSEMQIHHGPDATLPSETVVILHDAVYGHRFSRPRTSRNALSTIVERPERVKAAVLGVSLAYVRLGDRHDEGAHPVHPRAKIHEIPKIPFRIRKSTRSVPLTSAAVTNIHGLKWMEELKIMCDTAESKLALGGRELQRPENTDRDEPAQPLHEGDLYLCAESRDAMEGALGAVCDGVDAVFNPAPAAPRRAFVAVRPPGHHCAAAHPSGFCWVNNVLVGIMHGALTHGLTHAAIIDFDLHHGDGSQAIVWQHNARANAATKNFAPWKKTSIGYFSLHDINSYPCEMGDEDKVKNASLCIDNAHGQSVWNVHLQSWKTEKEFWAIYESKYAVILEKTRAYLGEQARRLRAEGKEPRAAIFFSAGFDASEWESAGMQRHQVNVPTEFYARLSQDVVRIANEQGLHVGGRVISVLEGGYSDRALFSGVFSHLSGLVGDQSTASQTSDTGRGLGYEMGQKLGTIAEPGPDPVDLQQPAGPSLHQYDPSWWSSQHLDSLETLVAHPSSPPRKPRTGTPPTYFSPTQASSAKVMDPVKVRRSLSGLSSTIQRPRAASPVAPDVPWTVAAHELSKILIPGDRQVDSCRAEDLNAEATRARRDKQSILLGIPIPPPTPAPQSRPTSRMALRERKARTAGEEAAKSSPSKRSTSRGARAKSTEAEQAAAAARGHQRRRSRRLSESTVSQSPGKEDPAVPVPPLPAEYEQHSRPPTSGSSSRAGSSMSGPVVAHDLAARNPQPPPASSGLNIKKTRQRGAGAATTPKEPTPKTPRTTARARAATPSTKAKTVAAKPIQRSQPPVAAPASEPPVPPVDKITTGMRKIKINLITQSQKAANALKKDTVAAQSSAPPPPLAYSHEPGVTLTTTPPVVETCPQLAPSSDTDFLSRSTGSGLSTPLDEQSSIIDSPSPLERRTPPAPTTPAPAAAESVAADGLFISYQPEGPTPVAVKREDSLKWLEPNVAATPSPGMPSLVKKKQGGVSQLFQYTAAGIPFAPRPGSGGGAAGEQGKMKEEEEAKSKAMWEVPETPHRI
ncbi:histone deacetylase HosB [Cordyceps fumosorosea ARSEF 2679]|uniref:Histone deacetylase HosB n=1 Tax=Cordyceps fumosorosea (strain ARSEF 2679) TaxID=1081104 RepID=A0A167RLW4_CORFA|nr:histone deacetylase HosB [Cordyceps fumosorosea ARSEF 2679]OAA58723.1 histone deacetylase HosB [Cordyceps fumosorosea ARSEF 2679]